MSIKTIGQMYCVDGDLLARQFKQHISGFEDCLEALEPFIDEVLPEEDEEFNLSVMDYMDSVALELVI